MIKTAWDLAEQELENQHKDDDDRYDVQKDPKWEEIVEKHINGMYILFSIIFNSGLSEEEADKE
jgi:hypothetical protein